MRVSPAIGAMPTPESAIGKSIYTRFTTPEAGITFDAALVLDKIEKFSLRLDPHLNQVRHFSGKCPRRRQ